MNAILSLGNVTYFLDVTLSNQMPHPLSNSTHSTLCYSSLKIWLLSNNVTRQQSPYQRYSRKFIKQWILKTLEQLGVLYNNYLPY